MIIVLHNWHAKLWKNIISRINSERVFCENKVPWKFPDLQYKPIFGTPGNFCPQVIQFMSTSKISIHFHAVLNFPWITTSLGGQELVWKFHFGLKFVHLSKGENQIGAEISMHDTVPAQGCPSGRTGTKSVPES